jgi:hypothetical protein
MKKSAQANGLVGYLKSHPERLTELDTPHVKVSISDGNDVVMSVKGEEPIPCAAADMAGLRNLISFQEGKARRSMPKEEMRPQRRRSRKELQHGTGTIGQLIGSELDALAI